MSENDQNFFYLIKVQKVFYSTFDSRIYSSVITRNFLIHFARGFLHNQDFSTFNWLQVQITSDESDELEVLYKHHRSTIEQEVSLRSARRSTACLLSSNAHGDTKRKSSRLRESKHGMMSF